MGSWEYIALGGPAKAPSCTNLNWKGEWHLESCRPLDEGYPPREISQNGKRPGSKVSKQSSDSQQDYLYKAA